MSDEKFIPICLSIVLAASVAYALNLLAVSIAENYSFAWAYASLILIFGTIGIIAILMDIKIEDIEGKIDLAKFGLIVFFSMFSFALGRLFHFRTPGMTSSNMLSYNFLLFFLLLFGLDMIVLGLFKEKDKTIIVVGLFIVILTGIFYFIGEPIMSWGLIE